jgi:hypothetical protein
MVDIVHGGRGDYEPSRAGRSLPGARCHDHQRGERMKSGREKAEEKRQAKLAQVQEQVDEGSLVIRKMTEEERRKYPPRPPRPKGPKGR